MSQVEFDLLGHPIPEGRGRPGRTGHVAQPEIASKIRVLLLSGMRLERIAREVGLSVPTLRKHYFANGRVNLRHAREMAVAEAKAKNLLQLQAQADQGNVSAMKEIRKVIEREEVALLDDGYRREAGERRGTKAAERGPAGKKEAAKIAALEAEAELDELFDGDTRVH